MHDNDDPNQGALGQLFEAGKEPHFAPPAGAPALSSTEPDDRQGALAVNPGAEAAPVPASSAGVVVFSEELMAQPPAQRRSYHDAILIAVKAKRLLAARAEERMQVPTSTAAGEGVPLQGHEHLILPTPDRDAILAELRVATLTDMYLRGPWRGVPMALMLSGQLNLERIAERTRAELNRHSAKPTPAGSGPARRRRKRVE